MLQPRVDNFGKSIGPVINVYNKLLDYSLIRINVPSDTEQSINHFEGTFRGFANPIENLRVFKYGAVTGQTCGIYDARSIIDKFRITIFYDKTGTNDSPHISLMGDSGSSWVTRQGAALDDLKLFALHYAGDETKNIAFASLYSSIMPSINSKIPQS